MNRRDKLDAGEVNGPEDVVRAVDRAAEETRGQAPAGGAGPGPVAS